MPASDESPLERICREAKERRETILAHPERYTRAEVDEAKRDAYQSARLNVADILRYGD